METFQTKLNDGTPVTINYECDHGATIVTVEWRGIELQDGLNQRELISLTAEVDFANQLVIYSAADIAMQSRVDELISRRRAA